MDTVPLKPMAPMWRASDEERQPVVYSSGPRRWYAKSGTWIAVAAGAVLVAIGVLVIYAAASASPSLPPPSAPPPSAPPTPPDFGLYEHRRIAGAKVLWPEGTSGNGMDHLPDLSQPGLLFFDHSGPNVVANGVSTQIAYTDAPDEATLFARCSTLCDAGIAWLGAIVDVSVPGPCDAFVAWDFTQYSGALGPDGANAYCWFFDTLNAPYAYYPMQQSKSDLGIHSIIYSKSALQ